MPLYISIINPIITTFYTNIPTIISFLATICTIIKCGIYLFMYQYAIKYFPECVPIPNPIFGYVCANIRSNICPFMHQYLIQYWHWLAQSSNSSIWPWCWKCKYFKHSSMSGNVLDVRDCQFEIWSLGSSHFLIGTLCIYWGSTLSRTIYVSVMVSFLVWLSQLRIK